jgi:ribosome-associated translation inhibitor RaiA
MPHNSMAAHEDARNTFTSEPPAGALGAWRVVMQTPLQIRFHGASVSEAVEGDVRRWVTDLEKVFPRLVSCHVTIELPHRHREQGRVWRVQVDVGIPGGHVIAGRTAGGDPSHQDVHVAVRDAFRAARRQLEDHADARANLAVPDMS